MDLEYRRLQAAEKECHAAARAQAKACGDILAGRAVDDSGIPELERTVFEVAVDRARAGAPVEDEAEKTGGERGEGQWAGRVWGVAAAAGPRARVVWGPLRCACARLAPTSPSTPPPPTHFRARRR